MIKVFFISPDTAGAAVHYFQYTSTTDWQGPTRIPGPDLQGWAPAVVAWAGNDSRLDVFAVSRVNNHLLHTFKEAETDKWTEYEDLKGFVTVPPTVVSREPGRLDVFTRGGDGGLWHLSFRDGNWSDWKLLNGTTKIRGQPHAKWFPENDGFTTLIPGGLVGPPNPMVDGDEVQVFAYNSQNQIVWQTIGSDKKAKGDARVWADVPYDVA
ncbi:hypothetical protein PG988_005903 [Apiospora saccharicola]